MIFSQIIQQNGWHCTVSVANIGILNFSNKKWEISPEKKREISPERNGDPSWLIGHKREFTQGKVTQTVTFKYVDKDYRVTSGLKMSPCAKHRKTPECSKSLAQDHITHSILGWSLKPAVMCFFSFKMFIIHQSQFSDETYLDAHTFTLFSLQKGYPIPSTVWSSY